MVEVVGALLSVMMIWIVTATLVYLAIQRVISQDYEIDASVMLIMAGLSVVFNIWSVNVPSHLCLICHHIAFRLVNVLILNALINIYYYPVFTLAYFLGAKMTLKVTHSCTVRKRT